MFKNMRSKLIWLATMIAGFVLIDIGELTGVINSLTGLSKMRWSQLALTLFWQSV